MFSIKKKFIFNTKKTFLLFILLFVISLSFAQNTASNSHKKVEILNANILKFDDKIGNGAKRLIGDVQFKHENVLLFCDSAYFYSDNSLDAFSHVHIIQDDTIHLYGDFLKYNGNTKKAVLTKNAIIDKGDMHLTTDVLNYDISTSTGFYLTPARIINKENILTSDKGYFYTKSNDLTFKKNVVLTNPQLIINCDTMRYNTASKITYFKGPTTIKSKANLIYCEDGWYDTNKDISRFRKNAYILTKDKKMYGDSLYYDRKNGIGKAVKNVHIIDTVQHLDITGDIAIYHEFKDLSIVTGQALLSQVNDNDTLFLHADTLKSVGSNPRIADSLKNKTDTLQLANKPKTNSDKLFAYHKVKFYKKDMQGKCDSLVYTLFDSTMRMYNVPTLWSDANQLTADSMAIVIGSKSIKTMELKGSAFIISKEDSLRFNQVRGKYMKGFFKENKLYLVNVNGNGQTIYYAKEEEQIKAVNRADCSDLRIYLKDNQMDKITFINKPDATLFPLDKIDVNELKLKDFTWREEHRPLSQKDIFNW